VKDPDYTIPIKYVALVEEQCQRHSVPVWLAARIIQNECPEWRPLARSSRNWNGTRDFGLMQINSANLQKFSEWYRHGDSFDPFSARDSLDVGLAHLRWLFEKYDDWQKAVCAYNAGETAVNLGCIPIKTIAYAQRILGSRFKDSSIVMAKAEYSLTMKGVHEIME
jgi:soluble lytic murein transglycosylase-like protein